MSTPSQPSVGEYYRLSLLDEAVVLYHSQKQDFIALQDYYLNCSDGERRYYFSGPDYMLLTDVRTDEEGDYWNIAYAATRDKSKSLQIFFDLAPFRLDRVQFCRYHKMNTPNPYKIYTWDNLQRISKYGLKTESTAAPAAATSPTCAATSSCSSSTASSKAGS